MSIAVFSYTSKYSGRILIIPLYSLGVFSLYAYILLAYSETNSYINPLSLISIRLKTFGAFSTIKFVQHILEILQGPELHLHVSTLQRPVLHLDMYTPQGPELHLDLPGLFWTTGTCAALGQVCVPQGPELYLDVSTVHHGGLGGYMKFCTQNNHRISRNFVQLWARYSAEFRRISGNFARNMEAIRKYYKQTEFRGHPSTNKIENTVKSKTTEMLETPVVKETSTAVGMAATAETLQLCSNKVKKAFHHKFRYCTQKASWF